MIATIADATIQQDVLQELKWDPSIDATNIGVAVKDGVVTLTGYVHAFVDKWAAEKAAKRVYGVHAVVNRIEVRLPGSSERTDEDIARDALAALRNNVSVPDDKIKVTVSDSWITLEGEVDWQYQKNAAEDAVRHLRGVIGVVNLISVKPAALATELKQRIEEAFKRSAEVDARRVSVEVDGGKVTLRGTVRSFAERDEAERQAWAAPGVWSVENEIRVEP
jgi:osmotically-inducible protein OsmY